MTASLHEDRSLSLQGQSSCWPGSLANDFVKQGSAQQTASSPASGHSTRRNLSVDSVPRGTFLFPRSVCASPDILRPQHRRMNWQSIRNDDRNPEGKTNLKKKNKKFLSHFVRQELWCLVRFFFFLTEPQRHCLLCLSILSGTDANEEGLAFVFC